MGLINRMRKTNIIHNVWTQMAQITILCGLITATGVSIDYNRHGGSGLEIVAFAALCLIAVVFIAWLLWFLYVVCAQRRVSSMNPKGYKILDTINFCLFVYWIISSIFSITFGAWTLPLMVLIWLSSFAIAKKYHS